MTFKDRWVALDSDDTVSGQCLVHPKETVTVTSSGQNRDYNNILSFKKFVLHTIKYGRLDNRTAC